MKIKKCSLINYINWYQLSSGPKCSCLLNEIHLGHHKLFSEQSLHILIAWQIFQQLFVIVRVLWCIIVVHVVLTELIPACVADVVWTVSAITIISIISIVSIIPVIVTVWLLVLWRHVWVWLVVLVAGLVHAVWIVWIALVNLVAWNLIFHWYLWMGMWLIVSLLLRLRRMVCIFGWVLIYWTVALALWVLDLHWAWLIFVWLLVDFLLLKNPCNIIGFVSPSF